MPALLLALALAAHAEPPRETVVLLHGMGRTTAAMSVMAKRFRSAGYATLNFPYYQKSPTLDELSDKLRRYLAENVKTERYHFVCHSLGCVIIRNALKKELRSGLGRIVMLAPPNRAARLAKLLKDNGLYRWLMGDSGQRLSDEAFYATLPVPKVEFAVIAGDKGQGAAFQEPNDGIVDVEGTKLQGMAAFAVVHHTHTFLMNAEDTFSLCRAFLEAGRFR